MGAKTKEQLLEEAKRLDLDVEGLSYHDLRSAVADASTDDAKYNVSLTYNLKERNYKLASLDELKEEFPKLKEEDPFVKTDCFIKVEVGGKTTERRLKRVALRRALVNETSAQLIVNNLKTLLDE